MSLFSSGRRSAQAAALVLFSAALFVPASIVRASVVYNIVNYPSATQGGWSLAGTITTDPAYYYDPGTGDIGDRGGVSSVMIQASGPGVPSILAPLQPWSWSNDESLYAESICGVPCLVVPQTIPPSYSATTQAWIADGQGNYWTLTWSNTVAGSSGSYSLSDPGQPGGWSYTVPANTPSTTGGIGTDPMIIAVEQGYSFPSCHSIPEPAAVSVWALLSLVGLVYLRRRSTR